jgi:hypothetical protein
MVTVVALTPVVTRGGDVPPSTSAKVKDVSGNDSHGQHLREALASEFPRPRGLHNSEMSVFGKTGHSHRHH